MVDVVVINVDAVVIVAGEAVVVVAVDGDETGAGAVAGVVGGETGRVIARALRNAAISNRFI